MHLCQCAYMPGTILGCRLLSQSLMSCLELHDLVMVTIPRLALGIPASNSSMVAKIELGYEGRLKESLENLTSPPLRGHCLGGAHFSTSF